jgi:GNAT superfamily N-acetyltransferase
MTPATLLAALPDLPRWVLVRGVLRSGRGGPVGRPSTDPLAMVVLSPETAFAGVVGRPPAADVVLAAAQSREVVVAPEDAAWVQAALPEWSSEPATLHVLPGELDLRDVGASEVDWLGPRPSDVPFGLPDELAGELAVATAGGARVAVARLDGRPASFCHAFAVTEGLWDVAVETVPECRRRGCASRAVRFLVGHFAREGKRPVWGSAASNPASAALARKLGFVPVDTVVVLTPP